jgi:hypothetical protein
MIESIRVYVNGRGVDVPAGSMAIDAVRAADAGAAEQVSAGDRALTDSRGLPLDPSEVLVAGNIVRVISGRRRGGANDAGDAFAG